MATAANTGFKHYRIYNRLCVVVMIFFMDLRTEIRNARKRAVRLRENSQESIFYTIFSIY